MKYASLVALYLCCACDSAEMQNVFEAAAFATPDGITRTDENGEVVSTDADDWRVSPAYMGRVHIDPAFPNPAGQGDNITVPVQVRQFGAVRGTLALVSYDSYRIARRLDEIRNARDPGAYVLSFPARLLQVEGLLRLYIVDNGGGLVSYGDVLIE